MKIAHFQADITPPIGHPLCAGWYPCATAIADRLFARGVILISAEAAPLVLCALDWAELSNLEHLRWRKALAGAVETALDRVAVHCVHNHDSPWPDGEAQALLDEHGLPNVIMNRTWCDEACASVAKAAAEAFGRLESVDNVRFGKALVTGIASNRRPVGRDGKVAGVRWTRCHDAELRALPEGDIDPWLRTASFWQNGRKLVSLHYYTVHPTSYDGTGVVTKDFPGLARERIGEKEGTPHIYFTGCAGNVTAGKYNDGETDNRERFTRKIYDAMLASEAMATDTSVEALCWRSVPLRLPVRTDVTDALLLEEIAADRSHPRNASRAALELAYRRRIGRPITLSALHFGKEAVLLHLPGEAFVEYQLYAQSLLPGAWLGTASYGDLGPGYICLARSFEEGGYEPADAFCAPESEYALKQAIRDVLVPIL